MVEWSFPFLPVCSYIGQGTDACFPILAKCTELSNVLQPIVLNLYERFYLPLQASLRPATKAFILALLPGLEEETGEFFEKVGISSFLSRRSRLT